jgi:hypothetical protein
MKASGPMTMQHPDHPQDERLAALADGDPEVTSDAALRAHVETFDRCTGLVRDLASLRTALAELPDLVPSRPLQLLPPVDGRPTAASAGWLRRLAGPAMAAGFVLVAVGAFGISGITIDMGISEIFQNVGENLQTEPRKQPLPAAEGGDPSARATVLENSGDGLTAGSAGQESAGASEAQPAPPSAADGSIGPFAPADPRLPWLVVLGLGVGLLLAGIYLRYAQQLRAG